MKNALLEIRQLDKPRSSASQQIDWKDAIQREQGKVHAYFTTKSGRLMYRVLADAYTGQLGFNFFAEKLKPMGEVVEKIYLNHLNNGQDRFAWIVLAIATANMVRGLNVYDLNPFFPQDSRKAVEEFFAITYHLFNATKNHSNGN